MTQKIGFSELTQDVVDAINAIPPAADSIFVNLRDYENLVSGGSWTPALNQALSDLSSVNAATRRLYVPRGQYSFGARPSDITFPLVMFGDGLAATRLIRNYNGSTGVGLLNLRTAANGCEISNMAIASASGTSGGHLVTLVSDASNAVSFNRLDSLYLTTEGTNTHASALYINGLLKTSAPIGVRDTVVSRCSIFGGSDSGVEVFGAVAIHFVGCDTFNAGGSSARLKISGDATVNSFYVSGDFSSVNGMLFEHCQFVNLKAGVVAGNITNASTAVRVAVNAHVVGTVQAFWTNSKQTDPTV